MTITSNISAMQSVGVTNSAQSAGKGQSPQDLLGFLNSIIQQLQQGDASAGNIEPAQNAAPGLGSLSEKIAAFLKKQGIDASTMAAMSPADLAAKIVALLQQQAVSLPPALQNMSTEDLADKIVTVLQNNKFNFGGIKSSLTSDLSGKQSLSLQDGTTKDEVADKITNLLEGKLLPQDGAEGDENGLKIGIIRQLKGLIAQLQSASGDVSADVLDKLKTDIASFLSAQGVPQPQINSYLADITKVLQPETNTSTPVTQALGDDTSKAAALPAGPSVPKSAEPATEKASTTTDIKNILGDNVRPDTAAAVDTKNTTAGAAAPANVTSKVAGMSVNPALINELAQDDGSGFSGNGFGAPNDGTQMSSDAAALLKPLNADALNTQNFTNYLSAARGNAPSPTVQMVTIQMQRNFNAGINSMTLQLNPADLGRLDVKLKFAKDGSVKAHMTVDKPETLALLQKDVHHLERALQQSGIDADENSISFDLRQNGRQENLEGYNGGGNGKENAFAAPPNGTTAAENSLQAQLAIQAYGTITPGGVNIMV